MKASTVDARNCAPGCGFICVIENNNMSGRNGSVASQKAARHTAAQSQAVKATR